MWHVKIVDGVLKQEPGPLEPGASSRSLAEFVSHALAAEPGWCSADAGLFEVEDVSGCGGSKTYKVAATHVYSPQLRLSSVALHCRLKPIMDRSSYFPRRMAAATRVFSASGLGPRRLAEGDGWHIDEWATGVTSNIRGHSFRDSRGRPGTVEEWAKIGELLAHVHQLPFDWFEETRQEIISAHPRMAEVPRASHIWGYFASMHDPQEMLGPLMVEGDDDQEDLLAAYLELGALVCVHPVAARVVTTHGDFHHGNILDAAGGLLCVDFESTCVSQAVQDLAYHFCGDGTKGSSNNPRKLAFLTAYLSALGEDPEVLEPLLVECELASICFFGMARQLPPRLGGGSHGMAWAFRSRTKAEVASLIELWKRFVAEVRSSATLREELKAEGLGSTMERWQSRNQLGTK